MTMRERLLTAQLRLDAMTVIQTAKAAFSGKQTDLDLEDAIEDLITSTDRLRSYVQDWVQHVERPEAEPTPPPEATA